MANRKISDLTALTAPATGDLLPIVDISEAAAVDKNKKITYGELLASAPAGSAAAPSFSFDGDPNSGLYSAGADQVAISTGGSGRLFVDASGNVGIKTNGANTGTLCVSNDSRKNFEFYPENSTGTNLLMNYDRVGGTYQALQIRASSHQFLIDNSERLRITSAGFLGVGTSTPAYTLVAKGGVATTGIVASIINPVSGGNSKIHFTDDATYNWTAGTVGNAFAITPSEASTSSGTPALYIDSSSRVGIGTTSPRSLLSFGTADTSGTNGINLYDNGGNYRTGIGATSSYLRLYTPSDGSLQLGRLSTSDGSTFLEAARIDSSGRLGIGTTSPEGKLEVSAGNAEGLRLSSPSYLSTSQGPWIAFNGGPSAGWDLARVQGIRRGSNAEGALVFYTNNGGSAPGTISEKARIDETGRLLVGTSSSRGNWFNTTFADPLVQLEGSSSTRLSITRNDNSDNSGELMLGNSRSSAYAVLSNNDNLGRISFQGADGSEMVAGAYIQCFVDGTPGANDMPGRLVFSTTADGAASPTERMRISANGVVSIGTTGTSLGAADGVIVGPLESAYTVSAAGQVPIRIYNKDTTGTRYCMEFRATSGAVGSITHNGSATAYNTSSDYRLKENVTTVTDSIARLQELKPSRFNFITNPDHIVDGFIAHEAQAVVPECVTGEKDAVDDDGNPVYQGIDQSKLVPLLTAALQEAIGRIETLEAEVSALKGA
jgi:hypothetical protein